MERRRGGYGGGFRSGGFRSGGGGFSPVKIGEELTLKIEAVGEKGDGIAKVKGFVIFVPGAKQGDEVRVKITKVFRKVGFGEIVGSSSGEETQETEQTEEGSEETQETSEETTESEEEPAYKETSEDKDSEEF